MSIQEVRIGSPERPIVMLDERPVRSLGAGIHRLVSLRGRVGVLRFQVERLTARTSPCQARVLPAADSTELEAVLNESALGHRELVSPS